MTDLDVYEAELRAKLSRQREELDRTRRVHKDVIMDVMKELDQDELIERTRLVERTGIEYGPLTAALKDLVDDGLLREIGEGKPYKPKKYGRATSSSRRL